MNQIEIIYITIFYVSVLSFIFAIVMKDRKDYKNNIKN